MTTIKRRMAMLVAVSAVSGVMTMFSPTTSAQAVPHDVCAGVGTAQLSSPFVYPESLNGPGGATNLAASSAHSAGFTFHLTTGDCVPSGNNISATGTVHGWCGFSIGSGNTDLGDSFHWVGVGGDLVVTGEVEGVGHAEPDISAGDTCVNHIPGANTFLVNIAVERQSCTVVNTPSQSTTSFSLGGNTSVNAGPASVHASENFFRAHLHATGTSFRANVRPHGHFSVQTSACA